MRRIGWHIAVNVALALALVAMLAVTFLPAQDVVLASPDSEITIDTGFTATCINGTSWSTESCITSGQYEDNSYRAGIDFDTTVIPDNATISKVELKIFISEEAGADMNNDVAKMDNTAQSYYDANNYSGFHADVDGNEYLSNSYAYYGTGSHTVELTGGTGNACTDLQNQLSANWFSVGWTGTTEADNKYRDADENEETNEPQIIVTYTLPPAAPIVTNLTGASDVTHKSARLNGELTQGSPDPTVHIYWGDEDGGTTPGSWDNDVDLGTKPVGVFYTDISGLTAEKTYYYRCYAINSEGSDWADSTAEFTTTSPSPYLQIVQTCPEKDSETWWEWIVVNPTDSTITVTEVRVVDNAPFDWRWTADNTNGWPTSGWTDGGVDGYYWSGSETVPAYSAKVFRSCPKAKRDNSADCTMTWSIAVTGFSPLPRETTIVGKKDSSWGGMFYNKPNDTTEQTKAGTYPDGLYAYLDEDTNGEPLCKGEEYTFYVNVHEWLGKGDMNGTLTITIPMEFTGVALVDYTDFLDANVSGGGASDWTITGTNDVAIKNSVDHLSFRATTPAGYGVNTNWEFDTRFTGTGGKNGTDVDYITEANVKVTVTLISITVTDGNVAYGTVAVGATEDTTASGVNETQTATNNGNIAEKFQIKSSNAIGGTDWTLGGSQGADTFTHKASIDDGSTWDIAMTAANEYVVLKGNVAVDGTQTFDLQIGMPDTITDYGEHTITVTVLATAA